MGVVEQLSSEAQRQKERWQKNSSEDRIEIPRAPQTFKESSHGSIGAVPAFKRPSRIVKRVADVFGSSS